MTTLITLNENSDPVGVSHFDIPENINFHAGLNELIFEQSNVPDIEILEQWRILNGVLTKVGPAPFAHYIWNAKGGNWHDPRTLADVKAAKNNAINQARAAANSSTFPFQGKQIAVDQLSRSDIDATHGAILMLQALPPGWPGAWKAVDNDFVPIPDVATWGKFYGAMVAQGTANFSHSQALKAQLAAASTVAEVEAVADW